MPTRFTYYDNRRRLQASDPRADSAQSADATIIDMQDAPETAERREEFESEAERSPRPDAYNCGPRGPKSVEICETMTLPESFDASNISPNSATICYDTDFLGYTIEEEQVQARLPFGGCCLVNVAKISLTGAIPYIINVGPVTSSCGNSVACAIQGCVMVDEVLGYLCADEEPNLEDLNCCNVIPELRVHVERCGNSGNTNITVRGRFKFVNLPNLA